MCPMRTGYRPPGGCSQPERESVHHGGPDDTALAILLMETFIDLPS